MTILQWIILGAFTGGVAAAVLSIVLGMDTHTMILPQPQLLIASVVLLLTGAIAGLIWIAIRLFGGH